MIERALVIGNGKEIKVKDLPLTKSAPSSSVESLEDLEKKHIQMILEKYEWNISKAARVLGIDRVTLYNKLRKHQIEKQN
jgi:transcriptional regulator of acetoin/glycerol metabolism